MKTISINPKPIRRNLMKNGFALITTLLIMTLLVVLAFAMMSLSNSTVRSTSATGGMAEAQANARIALMMAIGELQTHAGSDMRITAPADILNSNNPPLTGVWKSWEGSDHEATGDLTGRPKAPIYGDKRQTSSSGGRFLTWLVSGSSDQDNPDAAATLVLKTPSGTSVALVSEGSLASGDDRQVHVEPMSINPGGKYAWWVSGENQKAHLSQPYNGKDDSAAGWSELLSSHSVADPEVFGLESLLIDPSPAVKTFSNASADIFANDAVSPLPSKSFHDFSTNSVGLLTNVATGGWRKDFSLLTEKWDEQPSTGLEFFKLTPTEHLQYTRPASDIDHRPAKSMLYHWSDYRILTGNREFWMERGPIASWAKIKTYATLYKDMTSTTTTAPNINTRSWTDNGHSDTPRTNPLVLRIGHEIFHNIRIMPQMARIQFIVSHYATTAGATPGNYRPAVLYTPVVTLWNPYNTRLTFSGTLVINPSFTLPLALRHSFSGDDAPSLPSEYWAVQGGSSIQEYKDRSIGTHQHFHQDLRLLFNPNLMILEPGETRIFSPSSTTPANVTGINRPTINLAPGFRAGGGTFWTLDRRITGSASVAPFDPDDVSLPGSVNMAVDAKFDVPNDRVDSCGSRFQWSAGGGSHSWFSMYYRRQDADVIYPPKLGLASTTLLECANNPVPFLSMIFGSRIANHKAIATKGVVQAEPVVDFFISNVWMRGFSDAYPGGDSLLNCPWDFSYVEHSSGGDDMLPNVDNTTNSSYIVTGARKAEGLSRLVAAELPTRPLVSIADLSQMQIRGLNPTPPYAGNLVANSDATPLIPRHNIVNHPTNTRANLRNNEQQDDSYCANHVLFDDWFFSSIAPEPAGFGPSGQSLQANFTDFLRDVDPLANRAYRPILIDVAADTAAADVIYNNHVAPVDSWKRIASRLEVNGMFNVNSTSVKAWRALLGHARNQKIPYYQPNGNIQLTDETNYGYSRTNVAGDRSAGTAPQVAGEYQDTTEFTGHRVFTDSQLDFLAEKIVEQVRLRGPFLSLSEFVNRQLSTDNDLALAGAIQTALNALAADAGLNPFDVIQNESVASLAAPFAPGPVTGYVFSEAAVGHNTYGLPGWTRQADILRPLAPILSARDDTFTIRAYGDARSPDGKIIAKAWCEAIVRRTRDYNDPSDAADITTLPVSLTNQRYGRNFQIISFRWLHADEV